MAAEAGGCRMEMNIQIVSRNRANPVASKQLLIVWKVD
jgi:hypothetical protein